MRENMSLAVDVMTGRRSPGFGPYCPTDFGSLSGDVDSTSRSLPVEAGSERRPIQDLTIRIDTKRGPVLSAQTEYDNHLTTQNVEWQ